MNPDGTGLKRLTTANRDGYPTWSPDGKSVAFVRPVGQFWKIYVVPAKGGKPKLLAKSPPAGRPSWTTKGLLIPTGGDLVRVDTKDGHVLKYYGADIDAIWGLNSVTLSPSLKLLTYVGTRDPIPGDTDCGDGPCQRFGLYLENLTAKKKRGKLFVKDTGPAAFSPDGKDLVYVSGGTLVVKPVGSGLPTSITVEGATPITSSAPAWHR
jgi:Tol biopolymer transport system component